MTDALLIRFRTGDDAVEAAWVTPEGELRTRPERTDPATLAARWQGEPVWLVLPAAETLLTRATVPTRNRQRLRQAVPYALEDQLAEDLEALHFAIGRVGNEQPVPVVVIARRCLEHRLARLAEAGLEATHVYAEGDLLPRGEGWVLLETDADEALLRTGETVLAVRQADLPTLKTLLAPDTTPPLQVFSTQEALPEDIGRHFPEARLQRVTHPLVVLAREAARGEAIDLLQGDYARQSGARRLWAPWRAVAVLLVAVVAVAGLRQGVEYWRLQQTAAELDARMETLYRNTFPQARRVVNAPVQMRQQLEALARGQGAAGDEFLALLAAAGEPLAGAQGVRLKGLHFRDGRLDLSVTAPDVQTLEALRQRLAQRPDLQVDLQSASARGEQGVEGRLRLARVRS